MRGKHNKLGEGERKVRLGEDSLPNIAISGTETSGNYIRCFTRTPAIDFHASLIFAGKARGLLLRWNATMGSTLVGYSLACKC